MSKIFFIIGVNGIGKSTLIPLLREFLDKETFIIHDFDERGVPDNADKIWRQSETLHWINEGKTNLEKNISTIICGFSKPTEIELAATSCEVSPTVILLDANDEIIAQRIMSRYQDQKNIDELMRTTGKTPEEFIKGNLWTASKFREEDNYIVIDTSVLSPQDVAQELVTILK